MVVLTRALLLVGQEGRSTQPAAVSPGTQARRSSPAAVRGYPAADQRLHARHAHTDTSTIAVCKKHGVPVNCRARRVEADDFNKFDYILAMDQSKWVSEELWG